MKIEIVAIVLGTFFRTVAAAAIGSWLALATCPVVLGADGAQAAAAAKESAKALSDYAAGLARSGRRPDYSKPPIAEHFRHIFDFETLAALPPPQRRDIEWVADWVETAVSSYKTLAMLGVEEGSDLRRVRQVVARNWAEFENENIAAHAFVLRLRARTASTAAIIVNSQPVAQRAELRKTALEPIGQPLVRTAFAAIDMMSARLKPQNARLMMAAIHDTVTDWAPYTSAKERNRILGHLEKARAANPGAGIDEDVTAVSAAIRKSSN
jgi:hypothetical protein